MIPDLSYLARNLVRDLDPQVRQSFLKILGEGSLRTTWNSTGFAPKITKSWSLLVANPTSPRRDVTLDADFQLIMVQDPLLAQEP